LCKQNNPKNKVDRKILGNMLLSELITWVYLDV
jgi:hypothetical protein